MSPPTAARVASYMMASFALMAAVGACRVVFGSLDPVDGDGPDAGTEGEGEGEGEGVDGGPLLGCNGPVSSLFQEPDRGAPRIMSAIVRGEVGDPACANLGFHGLQAAVLTLQYSDDEGDVDGAGIDILWAAPGVEPRFLFDSPSHNGDGRNGIVSGLLCFDRPPPEVAVQLRDNAGNHSAVACAEVITGEGEGEPEALPGLGEQCFGLGCAQDLVCLFDAEEDISRCRAPCGDVIDVDRDGLLEPGEFVATRLCPPDEACLATTIASITSPPTLSLGPVACLEPASRDRQCAALDQPRACAAANERCVLVNASAPGLPIEQRCKVPCEPAGASCAGGEACLSGGVIALQFDGSTTATLCDNERAACDAGPAGCPCDAASGFRCTRLDGNGGHVCARTVNECMTVVPVSGRVELTGLARANFVPVPMKCDPIREHRGCDAAPYAGLERPAVVTCVEPPPGVPRDRVCAAICARADFDDDGNGVIDAGERAFSLECRAGEVCDRTLGAALIAPSGAAFGVCVEPS